ncbi:MAG: polyhydroxyalkanoic acid system family protein, partial [Bacteroidota bacterium]
LIPHPPPDPRQRPRVGPAPSLPLYVPDIDITRSHTLDREGARRAATDVAERLKREFRVRSEWTGDRLRVSGSGIRGELTLLDAAVRVTASLGLLARPFRNQLRQEIEKELDRALSHPA